MSVERKVSPFLIKGLKKYVLNYDLNSFLTSFDFSVHKIRDFNRSTDRLYLPILPKPRAQRCLLEFEGWSVAAARQTPPSALRTEDGRSGGGARRDRSFSSRVDQGEEASKHLKSMRIRVFVPFHLLRGFLSFVPAPSFFFRENALLLFPSSLITFVWASHGPARTVSRQLSFMGQPD